MRWGTHALRWIRPIHSILCVFDGKVVPLQFAHLTAGNTTRGHRFMAPEPFTVTGFADYEAKLRAAFVMLETFVGWKNVVMFAVPPGHRWQ